ncbi:MAG: DMT family transporter [Thermoanaerobaculum sp.]
MQEVKDTRALLATVGMAVLFGTSFVASKVALGGFSPTQLIFLRFAIAALFFALAKGFLHVQQLTREQSKKVLVLALLEPGIYFFLEAYGLKLTLASTAAVLIATIPLFVVLLEAFWLKVRVSPREVALILLSLFGVTLLLTAGGWDRAFGGTFLGNLLILGAAFSASLYTIVARKLMASVDALTVTRWQAVFATVFYFPFALGAYALGGKLPSTPRPWLAAVYLGLACSFGAYFLLNYALSRLRASFVSAFSNLIPVVASVLAVVFLGETLSAQQVVGAAIAIAAITALTLTHRPASSPPPPSG